MPCLGNLSNPSINRWGANLFWHKFWYTDADYALVTHQHKMFTKLIHIFLNYGILHPQNTLYRFYWYKNNKKSIQTFHTYHNAKYYRIAFFKNIAMHIDAQYLVRIKLKNIYFAKIWLFRYQGWLIINFYCFQPTHRLSRFKSKLRSTSKNLNFFLHNCNRYSFLFSRLKFFFCAIFALTTPSINNFYLF